MLKKTSTQLDTGRGYQNAVWNRKEELDISVRFVFEYVYEGRNYEVHFETTFTGRGGRFEILR